jgi:microcystin-dependent protein
MPIDFPTGPTAGDVYTYLGRSWVWNGTAWDVATPNVGDAFLPAGSIIQWSSDTAPANWLICDGAAVSRNTYSSLFAAIGTTYGVGDGSTTFNIPNLKGKVAVGKDSAQTEFDTLGEAGGAKTHTLTSGEMPSHTHTGTTSTDGSHVHGQYGRWSSYSTHNHYQGPTGAAESSNPDQGVSSNMGNTYASGSHAHTFTTTATGGGGAHNNLQPYMVFNYIIKASAGTTSGDSELATRLGAAEAAVGQRALSANVIINGAFDIWQRGTSFTFAGGTGGYTCDRFATFTPGGNMTVSRQTFSPGAAPVAGYEGAFFIRISGASSAPYLYQYVEDVCTLAGQTATLSFFAKRGTASTITTKVYQAFGSGGSALVTVNTTAHSVTTSWDRYVVSFAMPSLSGKTIGTNNALLLEFIATGVNDMDIWGVQLEAGPTATPFRRNAPSIQAELAACQRYYYSWENSSATMGLTIGNTVYFSPQTLPVEMRVVPTVGVFGTMNPLYGANTSWSVSAFTAGMATGGNRRVWQFFATMNSTPNNYSSVFCTFNTHGATFSAEL